MVGTAHESHSFVFNALPTPLPTLPHEDVARIDIRMIIRKKIERHR
jgi:hypothetical protein